MLNKIKSIMPYVKNSLVIIFFFSVTMEKNSLASNLQYFLKFNDTGSLSMKKLEGATLRNHNFSIISKFKHDDIYYVSVEDIETLDSFTKKFSDEIEFIEKVGVIHADSFAEVREEKIPDDINYKNQWGLHLADNNIYSTSAPKAWAYSQGQRSTKICIIDSGVDYRHQDLRDNIWLNLGEMGKDNLGREKATNGIDDDNNGYVDDVRGWDFVNNDNDPMDDNAHGTHVAGIVGAMGNNNIGVTGVNWGVQLIPLKILDVSGGGNYANAMRALEYCVESGAIISNNSYGGTTYSEAFENFLDWLEQAGHLFVSSAGNSALDNDKVAKYPAGYPNNNIISVGASDQLGKRSGFSNFGKISVDLFAPGEGIYSTVPGDAYKFLDGTSMAAPFVAGAAGLYLSLYPGSSAEQIKKDIVRTAKKSDHLERYAASGGVLNLYNLIEPDSAPPDPVGDLRLEDKTFLKILLSFEKPNADLENEDISYYKFYYSKDEKTDLNSIIEPDQITEFIELNALKYDGFEEGYDHENRYYYLLSGFTTEAKGFIYAFAFDNKNQHSNLSDSLPFQLNRGSLLKKISHKKLLELKINSPWKVVEKNNVFFLSDSPDGFYRNNSNITQTFPSIPYNKNLFVNFKLSHALESYFDYLIIEARVDGGAFERVGAVTGYQENASLNFDLAGSNLFHRHGKELQFRVRLTSDLYVNADGVIIRSVSFLN